jgi:hypothetical protein
MNIKLFGEILDEAFESLSPKDKQEKHLAKRSKQSSEGYGTLGREMLRIIPLLGAISRRGKLVVITSLLQEHPKWNRALMAAPAFAGNFFSSNYPGEVDLIGLVQERWIDDKKVYPPMISFESPENDFVCKWSGIAPREGLKKWPLNLAKIIMFDETV